ncbi:MAG: MoxR family ATPase [Pseudomonadota bacterium]|nr:MoxR family ATPase [Pseudomonadota bacterium]
MKRESTAPTRGVDNRLADWRSRALALEHAVNQAVLGLERPVRLLMIALFARGHVLLEGDVGVGKTTLLRALARGISGVYERLEGTIDLLPNDLIYYTYINEQARPQVDPGPLLKHGEDLSFFFFNEVNRARPQVHSLLLRVMAERSVSAFNREYRFPYLQVFADRNRVEKEETFEMPSAARDRFFMEIPVELPESRALRRQLMFDTRFHDVDALIARVPSGIIPFTVVSDIAPLIQEQIGVSETLETYALDLWEATRNPQHFGIELEDVDMRQLVQAGASPRGASLLIRAARVAAWLKDRETVVPEDVQSIFYEAMAHRVFFNPVFELRRATLARQLMEQILRKVASP